MIFVSPKASPGSNIPVETKLKNKTYVTRSHHDEMTVTSHS